MLFVPLSSELAVGITTFLLAAFVVCRSNFPGLPIGWTAGTFLLEEVAVLLTLATLECDVLSEKQVY